MFPICSPFPILTVVMQKTLNVMQKLKGKDPGVLLDKERDPYPITLLP